MNRILTIAAAFLLCTAAAVYADTDTEDIRAIDIGETRELIHEKVGFPDNVSGSGCKEIYQLDNGNNAVLIYDKDVLKNGYIVIE